MALDKATRNYVWGGHGGKREVHLLRWEMLIKPKKLGGAGVKSAKEMNWAMLAKLV